MSRARYVVKRGFQTVFILWAILTALFLLFKSMPGDPTALLVYQGASPEVANQIAEKWGLNDPLHVQYYRYLVNYLTLDPGMSLVNQEPVWEFVKIKIFNTMILVAPGITIGYILGTLLGAVLGTERGSKFEEYGVLTVITLGAFPGFFVGIVFILVFALGLDLFPSGGMFTPQLTERYADAPWWRPYLTAEFAHHYILPVSVVAIRYISGPSLVMRTSVVEVLGQDFIYFQKITGLPYVNRMRHIGKNSILPVVTLYPVSMTRAISGIVLIEIVFNWPGIGFALVQAVFNRDVPVIQFVFFLTATVVVTANFAVDLIYGIIDPRVSVEGEETS